MKTNPSLSSSANGNRTFWGCSLVTIASSLTSAGFSIAALSSSGEAHTNAMYALSRSLSLAMLCVVVVLSRSRAGLVTAASVMALVQTGDAIIGAINRDSLKTFGPAFLAVLTVAVLMPLLRPLPSNR